MDVILADLTVSMSDFKKNPAAVLRGARHKPVAVLSRNRLAFYALKPSLLEALMEELKDHELQVKVASRLAQKRDAIDVCIDTV